MRPIKFKAKAFPTQYNFWVTGSLIEFAGDFWIQEADGTQHRVDPTTIGEFSGLQDYYKTEIYEGDIVSLYNLYDFSGSLPQSTATVSYRDGQFVIIFGADDDDYCRLYNALDDGIIDRVVGNIHDKEGGER